MIVEADAVSVAGALGVLVAGAAGLAAPAGPSSSGDRARRLTTAAAAALAVLSGHAVLAATALLVAGASARSGGGAPPQTAAWAFLGDAVLAAGLGALALDAADPMLPWSSGAPVAAWTPFVVGAGVACRVLAVGALDPAVVVAGAVIGLRLASAGGGGGLEATALLAAPAAVAAWHGRAPSALVLLGFASFALPEAFSSGPEVAALLLGGGAVTVAGEAVTGRPVRSGLPARERVPAPSPGAAALVAPAAVPAAVLLARAPFGDRPETAALLAALLAVAAIGVAGLRSARPGSLGTREPAALALWACVVAVPLLAPGWWLGALDVHTPSEAAESALSAVRRGLVPVAAFGGPVALLGLGQWRFARPRS